MLLKVLWGFFRRDAFIHTSYKVGFAFELFSIFFSAATFYFVAKLFGNAALPALQKYGGDYFSFVLIGIAFSTYQSVGLNSFSQSLRQEQFLNTLEPIFLTPIRMTDFLMGSGLWDFAYATLEVILYLVLGALVFGLRLPHAQPLEAAAILFLTLFAFMGLGIISAAFIMRFKRGNPVTWMMATASELLGGVYFPVELLPSWMRKISLFVPMTHSLTGLRKCLLMGAGWAEIWPQMAALVLFIVVLWPIGLFAFTRALRRARYDGSLGHY